MQIETIDKSKDIITSAYRDKN